MLRIPFLKLVNGTIVKIALDFNDYPKGTTFHIGNSPTNDLYGNFLYYLKFNKNINIFAIIYKVEIGIQQCTIQRFTQTIQI